MWDSLSCHQLDNLVGWGHILSSPICFGSSYLANKPKKSSNYVLKSSYWLKVIWNIKVRCEISKPVKFRDEITKRRELQHFIYI